MFSAMKTILDNSGLSILKAEAAFYGQLDIQIRNVHGKKIPLLQSNRLPAGREIRMVYDRDGTRNTHISFTVLQLDAMKNPCSLDRSMQCFPDMACPVQVRVMPIVESRRTTVQRL